jgi:hypothetical protein
MSTDPNLKLCHHIEVLKVINKLTKFEANLSTFEPPIISLKTDRSDLRNLDRDHLSFFFLYSHLVAVF